MHLAAHLAALIAVLSTGVIYGTDAFCALVQRPALAGVDDATLTAVMGNVHRFGDRRLPVPGILGIIASAAATVLAALAGRPVASATAGAALALLVAWLLLYLRVSAPINRALTAAADKHQTPSNARALQRDWDRIIVPRAVLQGLAIAALCVSLINCPALPVPRLKPIQRNREVHHSCISSGSTPCEQPTHSSTTRRCTGPATSPACVHSASPLTGSGPSQTATHTHWSR